MMSEKKKKKKEEEAGNKEELEKLKNKPQILVLRLINRLGKKEYKRNITRKH